MTNSFVNPESHAFPLLMMINGDDGNLRLQDLSVKTREEFGGLRNQRKRIKGRRISP